VSTPHPELETLAQLADPELATLAEGELATAAEHVESCEQCTADLAALRDVHDRLAGLPQVAMPAEVASRLDAAIAAEMAAETEVAAEAAEETAGLAGVTVPATATATPTPTLRATGRPGGGWSGAVRGWRPGRPMPTSIAAAVAVLLFAGLGTAIALGAHHSSSSKSAASATAGSAAVPQAAAAGSAAPDLPVISSGTDYTTADFRQQISAVLVSRDPALSSYSASAEASAEASAPAAASSAAAAFPADSSAPAAAATSAGASAIPPAAPSALAAPGQVNGGPATQFQANSSPESAGGPLAAPAALQACVDYLVGAGGTVPVLVDHAKFDGKPATIITVHDPQVPGQLDVYVIDDSINCESGNITYAAFLKAGAGNQ
jgi:hypothetical protein